MEGESNESSAQRGGEGSMPIIQTDDVKQLLKLLEEVLREKPVIIITEKVELYLPGASQPQAHPEQTASPLDLDKLRERLEECLKDDPLHGRFERLRNLVKNRFSDVEQCRKLLTKAVVVEYATPEAGADIFVVSKCTYSVAKMLVQHHGINNVEELARTLTKLGLKIAKAGVSVKQASLILGFVTKGKVIEDPEEVCRKAMGVAQRRSRESSELGLFEEAEEEEEEERPRERKGSYKGKKKYSGLLDSNYI